MARLAAEREAKRKAAADARYQERLTAAKKAYVEKCREELDAKWEEEKKLAEERAVEEAKREKVRCGVGRYSAVCWKSVRAMYVRAIYVRAIYDVLDRCVTADTHSGLSLCTSRREWCGVPWCWCDSPGHGGEGGQAREGALRHRLILCCLSAGNVHCHSYLLT